MYHVTMTQHEAHALAAELEGNKYWTVSAIRQVDDCYKVYLSHKIVPDSMMWVGDAAQASQYIIRLGRRYQDDYATGERRILLTTFGNPSCGEGLYLGGYLFQEDMCEDM